MKQYSNTTKWLIIFSLGLAGEMIFSLRFHLVRFSRPTFLGVFNLSNTYRGVYFVLLEETNIAGSQTGNAVGLISLIGYTPDVFFNSVAGRILDANPGLHGFQNFFLLLSIFPIVGLVSTFALSKVKRRRTLNI